MSAFLDRSHYSREFVSYGCVGIWGRPREPTMRVMLYMPMRIWVYGLLALGLSLVSSLLAATAG